MDSFLEYSIQKLSKLVLGYAPNDNYVNGELVYKKSPVEADLTNYMMATVSSLQYVYNDHLRLIEEMSGVHRSAHELCLCFEKTCTSPFGYDSGYINSFEVAVLIDNERWERGLRDFSIAEFFINIYIKIGEDMLDSIDEGIEDDRGFFEMESDCYISELEDYMQKHDLFFSKKAELNKKENTLVLNAPMKFGVTAPKKR